MPSQTAIFFPDSRQLDMNLNSYLKDGWTVAHILILPNTAMILVIFNTTKKNA